MSPVRNRARACAPEGPLGRAISNGMISTRRSVAIALLFVALSLPLSADAANVFGGKVGAYFPCFNAASWNTVGAPRGGIYIWTAATKTYPKGPPGPGRWTIGLYGIPYFCLVRVAPLFVLPGMTMTMEASS